MSSTQLSYLYVMQKFSRNLDTLVSKRSVAASFETSEFINFRSEFVNSSLRSLK
jgi:hypothetical protein